MVALVVPADRYRAAALVAGVFPVILFGANTRASAVRGGRHVPDRHVNRVPRPLIAKYAAAPKLRWS
ncbi:hypothetical protein [Nocardia sp. NPDC004711]